MSQHRWHKIYSTRQVMGTNGRLACLQCGGDITDPRRSTFCSKKCARAFALKTSPNAVRIQVFERDKGICAKCGKDTMAGAPLEMHSRGSGHRWQADHIVPVIEGGGECDLSNYRTLCTVCHKEETAALWKRMAEKRRSEQPNPQLELLPTS